MGKKKRDKEETFINELDQKIFVVDGTMAVKKLNAADYLFSGKEYCPDCHIQEEHREGYWECPVCFHSITDDESENGEGHPSIESTYDDYSEYFSDRPSSACANCCGPYPDCATSCTLFEK